MRRRTGQSIAAGACVLAASCAALLAAGCTAPFSEYQSARMAGKGQGEITGSYSSVLSGGDEVQDQFGAQAAVGLSDRIDIRTRYERIGIDWSDNVDAVNVFAFGPKFALEPEHIALYVPFGFAFGEEVESSESWEVHPTVLFTQPVSRWLEVNISTKFMVGLSEDAAGARMAANVGLGVGPDDGWLVIRPEAGIMVYIEGGDPYYHVGCGLSVAPPGKKRSRLMEE